MQRRRAVLGTLAAAGALSIAGCNALDSTFERDASPAGVGPEPLAEAGFELRGFDSTSFEDSVSALGQSRELRLTNWLVTYGKELAEFGPDGARVRLFSTPSISVAGSEINPFHELGNRALVGEITDDDGGEFDEAGTRTVEVLGSDVEFTRHETSREVGGQRVTAFVHVGRLSHEGDLLTVIGVHPEATDESAHIDDLAEAIEHPFEFE